MGLKANLFLFGMFVVCAVIFYGTWSWVSSEQVRQKELDQRAPAMLANGK